MYGLVIQLCFLYGATECRHHNTYEVGWVVGITYILFIEPSWYWQFPLLSREKESRHYKSMNVKSLFFSSEMVRTPPCSTVTGKLYRVNKRVPTLICWSGLIFKWFSISKTTIFWYTRPWSFVSLCSYNNTDTLFVTNNCVIQPIIIMKRTW